ncbi:MAG: serine/threonine-protein kinase, partial [Dokdonella sp.]
MDSDRWQRVGDVFDAIVELDPADRILALAQLRDEDPDLHGDVERLLRGDAAIEAGAVDPVAEPCCMIGVDALPTDVAGLLIGPWRVIREIGRGGMGVVYVAERADGQYEQRAALKLMRVSSDPAGLRRRFLRERQILASLDHPHIARLLDGGVSPAGEPYFALEFIDGEPLTGYVAANSTELAERLRLFLEVCSAVQFAHRQLVVHCDIKPSNVIVNRDGVAKLLDFGIARLLGSESQTVAETQTLSLTPAYAAPEQLRGEAITTAADVYALGALLYELLTGVRAHQLTNDASVQERLAAIDQPRKALPSTVDTASQVLKNPSSAAFPAVPQRLLRGDLDTITATALQGDAQRRYASVEALSEDVRRYLSGTPIAARAPTARYRFGKFVRRHRVGVALSTIAVLALIGALAVALVMGQRAREQAVEARRAAAIALEQSNR